MVVALFGDKIRASLVPPRLVLTPKEPRGLKSRIIVGRGDEAFETDARWYFARVENLRRWTPADGVYIFVIGIEEKDASGTFRGRWKGEMPLKWRHGQDLLPRNIGHAAECDVCSVIKNPLVLHFHPVIDTDEWKAHYAEPCSLRLTLQAKGVKVDTIPLRLEISWDGKWSDDADDMAQHFVFREVQETNEFIGAP